MILHSRALLRFFVVLPVGLSLPASAQFEARLVTEFRGPQLQKEPPTLDASLDLRVHQPVSEWAWAEAALQTRFPTSGVTVQYAEVTLGTRFRGDPERTLWLKVMPFTPARERLGFDPLLGFGSYVLPNENAFAAHAQLELGPWRAWVATQSALALNELTGKAERRWAPSAGLGYRTPFGLRADAMAAYYALGPSPALAARGVKQETFAAGVAARVEYAHGDAFAPLWDLERYRTVNEFRDLREATWRPQGESARGYRVSVEAIAVRQDAEQAEAFAEIAPLSGVALQAQADASFGALRAQLQLVQRDPVFLVSSFFDTALLRDLTLDAADTGPERFAGASVEGCLEAVGLCPGVTVRLRAPAHFATTNFPLGPPSVGGAQTVVMGSEIRVQLLPLGTDPSLVPSASASLRWAPLSAVRIFGQLTGSYDRNRYVVEDDASGAATLVPDKPWVIGGDLVVQLVL